MTSRLAIVLIFLIVGCQHPTVRNSRPTWIREFSMVDSRRELHLIAPEVIAAGDTDDLKVERLYCQLDLCRHDFGSVRDSLRDAWTWGVDQIKTAIVRDNQQLITRHAGVVWITATKADTVLRRRVQVLPPVATVTWEPNIVTMTLGDTIRIRPIARDSSGRVVGQLNLLTYRSSTGNADARVLQWGGSSALIIVPGSVGTLELRAMLGRRLVTHPIVVTAR